MQIKNSVAIVTGANRGIGLAFVKELIARGAKKIYAGARDPADVTIDGVEPIKLDVTRADDVVAAATRAKDVTLVVNNAGIGAFGGFLNEGSEDVARSMLETNYFGVLRMSSAFAPTLALHGGGALLNVLSIASFINGGQMAAYAASKSAAWSLTNSLRHELAAQKTQVLGLHMAFVDTDMVRALNQPKCSPADVVKAALDGLEQGLEEVFADERTRAVQRGLTAPRSMYLPPLK